MTWEAEAAAAVAARIASIRREIDALPKASRIPGNLTRRKDNSALHVASAAARLYERQRAMEDRIARLRNAPLSAVYAALTAQNGGTHQ